MYEILAFCYRHVHTVVLLCRLVNRMPAKLPAELGKKKPLLYTVTDVDEKPYSKTNNGVSYNHKLLEVRKTLE